MSKKSTPPDQTSPTDVLIDAATGTQKKAGNVVVRMLVGVITLLLKTLRGVLAAALGAVGKVIGGAGGAVNGLTSGVRQVLVGAAKAISPLDHSAKATSEDSTRSSRQKAKETKKAA